MSDKYEGHASGLRAAKALQRENTRRLLTREEFLTQEEIAELIERETGLAELLKQRDALLESLICLYDETADYIRINNLGDVHHNASMQKARAAIKLCEEGEQCSK